MNDTLNIVKALTLDCGHMYTQQQLDGAPPPRPVHTSNGVCISFVMNFAMTTSAEFPDVLVNASQSSDASPLNSVAGSATMQEHIGFRE
jgi:hypothetical protein